MSYAWVILLVSSLSLLGIVLLKTRGWMQFVKYAALNLVVAGFVLYFLRFLDVEFLNIAINPYTIFTLGVLGLPGLGLLVALNYTLF
ncbi:hypothetical protein SY83_05820 [Paenibacillus swuensis]|uniref:Pro-sigmaK processing inhibitor BofA n=1 Tax=Paenibacillus swuensis TaxID=1178515 RepID=A0A172TFQ1_9BACL|nr:pro-sigmaK processing inhibitor BofA family protein [Paenibacillus swuensis]ANE45888.1 hypothetical protein SY83_05820 [Paenibacillus swuensis]